MEYRIVKRNGKKQVIPIKKKSFSVQRRVTTRDLLKWPPEKIGKVVRSCGFENSDDDPFEFTGKKKDFSVNGMRLSDIDQVYVGEESVSFYRNGKEAASVFYSDLKGFNQGGKKRIGGK
ncbi:MAG: hypothetical protein M1431_04110 [Candidatus Thermoplasmatota archaeon]|nr:hypothetical protein [Candidatus Thermoplasmatota archaeon]